MSKLMLVMASLLLGAQVFAASIPDALYSKTTGSCQSGDLTFSAITFVASHAGDTNAIDVYLYLNPSGAASLVFSAHDSGSVAQVATTTWSSSDPSSVASVQKLGNLNFLIDTANPRGFDVVSFTVLSSDLYTNLPLSQPNQAYMAFPGASVQWNERGLTASQICGN